MSRIDLVERELITCRWQVPSCRLAVPCFCNVSDVDTSIVLVVALVNQNRCRVN